MKKWITDILKDSDRIDVHPAAATADGHAASAPSGGGDHGSKLQYVLRAIETIRASKDAWDLKSNESAAATVRLCASKHTRARVMPAPHPPLNKPH